MNRSRATRLAAREKKMTYVETYETFALCQILHDTKNAQFHGEIEEIAEFLAWFHGEMQSDETYHPALRHIDLTRVDWIAVAFSVRAINRASVRDC